MERWEMGWVQIKEMDHDTAKRCTRCKHVAQEQERRREEIRLKRVEAGRKGGQASTPMKRLTARLNGLLGTPSKCLGGVC
jgi:general stress protein YciG